jgi:hypothetical protein
MGTWGDVARRLREPVQAALLVAAVVVAPLAVTLVVSSEAAPAGPGPVDQGERGAVVKVPAALPEPETAERQLPILAAESPTVQTPGRRADDPARDPASVPQSEPLEGAPEGPSGPADPPAEPEPPTAPEQPPPAAESPPQPPPAGPPAPLLPDDPLGSVGSTVGDVVEVAEEAVEEPPLPELP